MSKCDEVKCPPSKICNPKTGKCVLRKGKIGQSIVSSISITHPIKLNELKYLGTRFAPSLPSSYLKQFISPSGECDSITNYGQKCKSIYTAFRDTETNTTKDCSWYCLSKCQPDKLKPLLNVPDQIILTIGNKNFNFSVIDYITISFQSLGDLVLIIRRKGIYSGSQNNRWEVMYNGIKIEEENTVIETICRFIHKNMPHGSINFEAEITLDMTPYRKDIPKSPISNMRFNHPWIRPEEYWNVFPFGSINKQVKAKLSFDIRK